MKKKHFIIIIINLIFWLTSAWLLVSGFSIVSMEYTIENGVESKIIERDTVLIIKIFALILISAVLFYLNLFLISSHQTTNAFSRKTILISLGALISSLGIFQLLLLVNLIPELPVLPLNLVLGILCFYYAISWAYGLGISWYNSEEARRNLMIQKNEAELSLLRNQLQPHFLFNALNNLLSLINQKQYSGASHTVEKLAHLLRYVVEHKGDKVQLSQEISFIENYIALQMLRFQPDEVEVMVHVTGDPESKLLEPGLFLPFVENAFKYGTEPETQSRIDMLFDASVPNEIRFSITNPVLNQSVVSSTGTGLDSTRKKLDLIYPDRYELDIAEGDVFKVNLKLVDL